MCLILPVNIKSSAFGFLSGILGKDTPTEISMRVQAFTVLGHEKHGPQAGSEGLPARELHGIGWVRVGCRWGVGVGGVWVGCGVWGGVS